MSEISIELVRKLREMVGAGILDCRTALVECQGDIEKAVDWLRKKGIATASKKSGRVAAEGGIAVGIKGNTGIIIELNSETDFVARNEQFQLYLNKVVELGLTKQIDVESIKNEQFDAQDTFGSKLISLIASIGENISLRRIKYITVKHGVIAHYLHNKLSDNIGRLGVLVTIESEVVNDELHQVAKKLAMHIAAANPAPLALNVDGLPKDVVDRELAIITEQTNASGRPEAVVAKIIEGKMNKFYGEVVLNEQNHIIEGGDVKVKDVVEAYAKKHNTQAHIGQFMLYKLGEGLEVKSTDFASEVAAIAQQKQ